MKSLTLKEIARYDFIMGIISLNKDRLEILKKR